MIILGLIISNGLVAVSGALIAQSQSFADVQMGIGSIVIGLASVIIGEVLLAKGIFQLFSFLSARGYNLPCYHRLSIEDGYAG